MASFIRKLLFFVFLAFTWGFLLHAADGPLAKRYDERFFVISNYSGVDAIVTEDKGIAELLGLGVDGFRFQVDWVKAGNTLVVKSANGKSVPFIEVLNLIKANLDKHPQKVFTIFLDFNVNINELIGAFEQSGLINYAYSHDKEKGWPTIGNFINSQRRLVVFSMQEHRASPDWIHYIWKYTVEPYFSLMEAPDFIGEYLKGDPKNELLIYNEFNIQTPGDRNRSNKFDLNFNPYLLEHIKNVWAKTGKAPNFIMLDRFDPSVRRVVSLLNGFKILKGTVTFNTQLLDYVSWDGRNSLTSGKFSFPIGPGDNVTLTPRSPGYRFKPESVAFGELTSSREQHFIALPLDINENLEAYYNFDNNTDDISGHGLNGNPIGVVFRKDSVRGTVAFFNNKSHVVMPKAEDFKVRDHDFTVAAWIKVERFLPGKSDYCILGTPTNSYQEGIHLVLRNRKPYFGFYSNDLEGNTLLEENRWYHVVWRYTKQTGEQAIYVDGKLDSRSLGHPSYKGKEKLFIGVAGFSAESNMFGSIDNLILWSRPLGNEEIWGLSKNIVEVLPVSSLILRYYHWFLVAGGIVMMLIFYLLIKKWKRTSRNETYIPKRVEVDKQMQKRNYIRLFGDFVIVDKNGEDISSGFTPKLKQLFLVILTYSQHNKKGISTKELTDIVWPNHSYQNAKNSRGVTIRKLRLILEGMDKVEIKFHVDTWTMEFSGSVYCDYIECLRMLEYGNNSDINFYREFFKIVKRGEVFKGESHDWLDDFKGHIVNNVVDILIKYIQKLHPENDLELIIKLAERILVADPVNEEALAYKLSGLVKQNNYKVARFAYEKFTSNYMEMYGEKFGVSFEKMIDQVDLNAKTKRE